MSNLRSNSFVVLGNARFTVYSPGAVRLEYAHGGRFSPYPSLLMDGRLPRPANPGTARFERRGGTLHITTDRLTLDYTDTGRPFDSENLRIEHRTAFGGRHVWRPGMLDRGNLGATPRSLDFWRHSDGPGRFPVEGILSRDGGHYLADEARVYWNTRHDWPENLAGRVESDGCYFAYGDDYKAGLGDFIRLFGRIPLVPLWAFGFWYSRWDAIGEKEILALAAQYRRAKIPMDVMVIDTDWRKGWGGYDWNPRLFPDPRRAIKRLHALGLKVGLNDHPGYDNYDALPDDDSKIPAIEKRLGALPHQGQWACDWSRKEAVAAWREIVLGAAFKDGLDFWWVDGWLKPPFGRTPLGGSFQQGTDSQLWANRHFFELAREKTGKRGLILSRWGGIGSHRYPVQFSGDAFSEWGMLRHEIEMTVRSAGLGAAYWSHDIGGFFEKKLPEELFVRWFQFGAMSPVFRTHSHHGIREPWKYGARAAEIFRRQTRIRYALAPYWYALAREAHESGLPLVRPLWLEHPDCVSSYAADRQYLLGRDILVIPADEPAASDGLTAKRAVFPPGRWIALEDPEILRDGGERTIRIPLERLPTWIRSGAIIPLRKVGENLAGPPPAEIRVEYYPDEFEESRFELYEDDGVTNDHEKGDYALRTFTGRRRGDRIEFEVGPARGKWKGMPRRRTLVLGVWLEPGEEVAVVEMLGGRRPSRAAGAMDGASRRRGAKRSRALPYRLTRRAFAGEIRSPHRYAEVELPLSTKAMTIRIDLSPSS
jgi:hypothetical protein